MAKLSWVNRLIQIKKRVLDPDSCVQVGSQFVAKCNLPRFYICTPEPINSYFSIYPCTKCYRNSALNYKNAN